MEITSFLLTAWFALFATVDPLGNVPFYVTLTENLPRSARMKIIKTTVITAGLTLTGFALFGNLIFCLFGITIPAFRIAGGLLLLRIAFSMLQGEKPRTKQTHKEKVEVLQRFLMSGGVEDTEADMEEDTGEGSDPESESVGVVPLGIPLFAGPGGITMIILLSAEAKNSEMGLWGLVWVLAAILGIMVFSYVTLYYADPVFQKLGRTGTLVLSRIFGLILAAIAIQLIITGVTDVATIWYLDVVGGGGG
ncbi:MAG: MarC family protein [Thermoplasmata archaeon]|nr:MarC family protein [Thermoplasmata archaeon]